MNQNGFVSVIRFIKPQLNVTLCAHNTANSTALQLFLKLVSVKK